MYTISISLQDLYNVFQAWPILKPFWFLAMIFISIMICVWYCSTIYKIITRWCNDSVAEIVTIACGAIVSILFILMFMYVTCSWIGGSCPL